MKYPIIEAIHKSDLERGDNMNKDLMIAILEQDRCTRREAERFINQSRVIIYKDPAEYIQMLKDNDVYEGETIEDIRRGLPDVSAVKYNGHEYIVVYFN